MLICVFLGVTVGNAQKAFETVNYVLNYDNSRIKLIVSDGYPEGSRIEIINKNNKTIGIYLPDAINSDYNTLRFNRVNAKENDSYFMLYDVDHVFNMLPSSVGLIYYKGKDPIELRLKRK